MRIQAWYWLIATFFCDIILYSDVRSTLDLRVDADIANS